MGSIRRDCLDHIVVLRGDIPDGARPFADYLAAGARSAIVIGAGTYAGGKKIIRTMGMRLVKLPTIANKYLDTMVHSFLSSLHALPKRHDIALYFIAGAASMPLWIRLARRYPLHLVWLGGMVAAALMLWQQSELNLSKRSVRVRRMNLHHRRKGTESK